MNKALIATGPDDAGLTDLRDQVEAAIRRGGGTVVPPGEASGLVWLISRDADGLRRVLDENPGIEWVQLPVAGVDSFVSTGVLDRPAMFTCTKGAFAGQVAEHALLLTLACLRHLVKQTRTPSWGRVEPTSLTGRAVTIVGAGGITEELMRLLAPFNCRVRVLRRRPEPLAGADETLPVSALHSVLPDTDILVLALALTPQTHHIIGAAELALLPAHATVVNVARGPHIDTDALVKALREGEIAAAGLDVTDPEPLPASHPLWSDPRALITSHSADSVAYVRAMLCERVEENIAHLLAGETLAGVVDVEHGY